MTPTLLGNVLTQTTVDRGAYLQQQPIVFHQQLGCTNLLAHFVACGQGNMVLLVFPNGSVWLVDCNLVQDCKETVLEYLKKHIPQRNPTTDFPGVTQWIDVFVNTHRDADHLRGLSDIDAAFPVRKIIESGVTGEGTSGVDYKAFMNLRRVLTKKFGPSAVSVPMIGTTYSVDGVSIEVLNGNAKTAAEATMLELALNTMDNAVLSEEQIRNAKPQHTNSLAFQLRFAGKSMLLTGDTDYIAWRDRIVPRMMKRGPHALRTDILMASHHGSREFFTDTVNTTIDPQKNPTTTYVDHLPLISPKLTVCSCGDYDQCHLPNEDAIALYEEHTNCGKVHCTQDFGSLIGLIRSDGFKVVVPTSFAEKPCPPDWLSVELRVKAQVGATIITPSTHTAVLGRGTALILTATSKWVQLHESRVEFEWDVANGAVDDPVKYQALYHVDKKKPFETTVQWRGLHLLSARLKVYNNFHKEKLTHDYRIVWKVTGV